ncbi:MAG TPA: ABC transporter ATP-binding protein [Candidatus Competibacteraceae bacterium]|nr:ABC transporter ATP-binding protein [Candidatus Competibacteraceae bacterium]MCP5132808.1 ABC transporter ATP-binding protein [Gammaproteobacteria bacterium]HPF57562.1 ABC transporter ATP-binding protein [Candidatus Competibacteraceae bacterium]HRY16917.1 ABC transporter ATP-binding protein [Candidatus Competibacteraceae bacterium]
MIELVAVCKIFHQDQPNECRALHEISLTLDRGGITVFKGPSGSGKTTLLTVIGGLARPTSGRIALDGRLLSNLPERFLTEVRRHHFGFVFQQFNLIRGLSVLENVMLPAYPLGRPYRELVKAARELLDRFGLGGKATSRVEWLSGGEAQRTALARALINNPATVIADEPTANLDSALSQEVLALFDTLAVQGRTVLISSHDPLVFGASCVNRVIELHDGRLVAGSVM